MNYPEEIWCDTDLVGDDEAHDGWQKYQRVDDLINIQHEETGRMQEWPTSQPIPRGWARVSESFQPQSVIRTLREMNGDIRCPNCNATMQRCGVDGYKCRKCREGWNVNPA